MSFPSSPTNGQQYVLGFKTWQYNAGTSTWDLISTPAIAAANFQASGTGAVSRTALSKMRERVSVLDFGAVGDGVANDSIAIQAAIDAQSTRGGGVVYFPPGTYKCNVVLKNAVILSSGMGGVYGYLNSPLTSAVTLQQAAAGVVVDTPSTSIVCCGVEGINFAGLGAGTPGIGVRFQNAGWSSVKGCMFNNFADQAILKMANNACTFEDILVTNCLMNRVRTQVSGCVEMAGGADDFLNRIEANPSLSAIYSSNLYICGILLNNTNSFATNCIGEFAETGIYVKGFGHHRVSNCRGDLNWGHGFVTSGISVFSNCVALNDSQAGAGLYSGFVALGQGDSFTGCRASGNNHKYGFDDSSVNYAQVSSRTNYTGCSSVGHTVAAYSTQGFLGSSPQEPAHPIRDGSTGSVSIDTTGTTFVVGTSGSAVVITNFTGAYSGKTVSILPLNGNYAVQNNANISTSTGANKLLVSGSTYRFTHYNGKWYESAAPSLHINVKDFGAVGDGVADDTAAVQAAITLGQSSATKTLFFPNGIYSVTSMLNFGGMRVLGEGTQWQSVKGTIIRAATDGMVLAKLGSGGRLENLVLDGNNLAWWVLMVEGSRPAIYSIETVRGKEYGTVMNSTQNGAFTNLNCRFNGTAGLVMANGVRNCNFYNYTSSVEGGPTMTTSVANSVCIRWLIDVTNPRGLGLTTAVTAVGNDRNSFFGGISETFNSQSLFVMDTQNPNNWVGQNAGDNVFYSYELTGGNQIISTDSTFNGVFHFHHPAWIWNGATVAATSGNAGALMFYGNVYTSGGGNFSQHGVAQKTNMYRLLRIATNEFSQAVLNTDYFLEGGGSTVTFNATTKTFTVASPGNGVQGLGLYLRGMSNNAAQNTLATIKPILRITFTVANIVGGAGQISVYADLSSGAFRRLIQNVAAGTYQLLYKCQGDEAAGVSFTLNGVTSFDVSDVLVEVI